MIGIHTTTKRKTKERSFIAFTSRGALFDDPKECGTRSRLRRFTCCDDLMNE